MRLLAPFLTLGLVACGGGSGSAPSVALPTSTLSMAASDWVFSYSPGMPQNPTPALPMGWQFDFPLQDGVHYLLTPFTADMSGKTAISVSGSVITNDGVWTWPQDECSGYAGARAHLMIQHQSDDLTGSDGRFWGDAFVTLANGSFSVSVPLTPEHWTNVDGKPGTERMAGWQDILAHPGHVGLTFGGGCFFGHGVWLQSGSARFVVTQFAIQ